MCKTKIGPVFYLLAALMGLAILPPATIAADLYDVSYVWSGDLAAIQKYRQRVAGVLGAGAAKDLKVVARGKLYGLIYARRGDSAGATRVAQSHTRLLRSRGLQAASPVRSENWTLVGDTGARKATVASPAVPSLPKSKMTEPAVTSTGVPSTSKNKMTTPVAPAPAVPDSPKSTMTATAVASLVVPGPRRQQGDSQRTHPGRSTTSRWRSRTTSIACAGKASSQRTSAPAGRCTISPPAKSSSQSMRMSGSRRRAS